MQMEDKIEEISKRLDALENEYHSDKKVVRAVAAVFVVLLVAFFGISLSQIKSHVNKAMDQTAINEAKGKAVEALETITKAESQANQYANKIKSLSEEYELTPFYEFKAEKAWRYRYSSNKTQGRGWKETGNKFYAFTKKR